MKDQHVKYVNEVVQLSDAAGKKILSKPFAVMQAFARIAKGNPSAFLVLLKTGKEAIIPIMVTHAKATVSEARTIGKNFMKVKKK